MRRHVLVFAAVVAVGIASFGPVPTAGAAPPTRWRGEQAISPAGTDSWEPEVAADPSSAWIYVAYRWHSGPLACRMCPNPPIVVQASPDGGATWKAPAYVCRCQGVQGQFDPVIAVTASGIVYATWMNWYDTMFAMSVDHGATWSAPVTVSGGPWSDHPWFGASADGRDIYVFWSHGDAFEVHSHDFGATWSTPMKINTDRHHYYYPEGVAVLPNGTVLMAAAAYPCGKGTTVCAGSINISVFRSTNAGASFSQQNVESVSSGVDFATSALASIAGDAAGNAVVIYTGASSVGATSQVYVRRSTNSGSTWSVRTELGAGASVNAAFPAIVGAAGGSFHAAFMDTRTGAWNTWYRSSNDGGVTWDPAVRISDASSGAPYRSSAGFANPYGDYLGIDVIGAGQAVAAWGAAASWSGPGDIWFNGQT